MNWDKDAKGLKTEAGLAERLHRAVPALSTQALRVAYLRSVLGAVPVQEAARALDVLCEHASHGQPGAKEVLISVATLLQEPQFQATLDGLRLCAQTESLLALAKVLPAPRSAAPEEEPERKVPDYGAGRPLTLGERKALARRPNRKQLDRLLADPHPQVIFNLLNNSMTTEDDVVTLAARRPLPVQVLREVARHPRWNVRRRVRLALVLNPHCPAEVGIPLVGLLLRAELRLVAQAAGVEPSIRQAALDRLQKPVELPGPPASRERDKLN